MKSILDRTFRYTSSVDADLKKTFARVRREQRRAAVEVKTDETERSKVQVITPKKRACA